MDEKDDAVCLRVDPRKGKDADRLHEMLCAWAQEAARLKAREISQEDYDRWRHYYPEYDTTQRWMNVPSQELSDALVEAFKDDCKE